MEQIFLRLLNMSLTATIYYDGETETVNNILLGIAREPADHRPMFMAGGNLYMDTNQEIPAQLAGSAIAGRITSATDASSLPAQNGESNFGAVGAPYAQYADGMIVYLNERWIFFEKEPVTTDDPLTFTPVYSDETGYSYTVRFQLGDMLYAPYVLNGALQTESRGQKEIAVVSGDKGEQYRIFTREGYAVDQFIIVQDDGLMSNPVVYAAGR